MPGAAASRVVCGAHAANHAAVSIRDHFTRNRENSRLFSMSNVPYLSIECDVGIVLRKSESIRNKQNSKFENSLMSHRIISHRIPPIPFPGSPGTAVLLLCSSRRSYQ